MKIGEFDTGISQRVNIWSLDLTTETADVGPTEVVSNNEQKVRQALINSMNQGRVRRTHRKEVASG